MKIVRNTCFGGFGLSKKAVARLSEITGKSVTDWDYASYDMRTAPELVQVVEELGAETSDGLSDLEVVEIPDDVEWDISDYDGIETIEEVHRSW